MECAQRHEYALPHLLETSKVGTPLYPGEFRWQQWVSFIEVPLYKDSVFQVSDLSETNCFYCSVCGLSACCKDFGQ